MAGASAHRRDRFVEGGGEFGRGVEVLNLDIGEGHAGLGQVVVGQHFERVGLRIQLENFLLLDDSDIIQGLKCWQNHKDKVLSKTSNMLINRNLLKIKIQDEPFEPQAAESKYLRLKNYGLSEEDYQYFVFTGEISNQTYVPQDKEIWILAKSGRLKVLQEADSFFNSEELSRIQQKYFLCFPRNRHLT